MTVNAPVVTSGATAGLLTKTGAGSLILGGTNNVYTGATRVARGKLFINGSLSDNSSAGATVTVESGAVLGGSGTIGRHIVVAAGGGFEFNLGSNAASHVPLTRSANRNLTFSGASVLTITSSGGASPGLYTLITGGNNLIGSAPATVILPAGWAADPPVISGNKLQINITTAVTNPNLAPVWTSNPVIESNATEGASYSGTTLANDVTDANSDPLTFAKVSGPAWLVVAPNGTLSGTPTVSDTGANVFTVNVSDGIAAPVQANLNIMVININDAPVWTSNPLSRLNASVNTAYASTIAGAATDVDPGTTLTYAKVSGAAWLAVGSNGSLSGTPGAGDLGANAFTVSVSDGIAAPVSATLNINVTATPMLAAVIYEPFADSDQSSLATRRARD